MFYSGCAAWNRLYPSVIRCKPDTRIETSTLCEAPGQPVPSTIITCAGLESQPLSYQAGTTSRMVDIGPASFAFMVVRAFQVSALLQALTRVSGIRKVIRIPACRYPGFLHVSSL